MSNSTGNDAPIRVEMAKDESLRDQLGMMFKAFMASPVRNTVLWLGAGVFVVILATSFGQVLLNRWSRPFYDTLERRDFPAFLDQLLVFFQIAGCLLVVNIAQTWLSQMTRMKLRQGLTQDLITEWMRPGRAFRMANAGAIGVNPDQRLHEDARHLTDLSTDLAIELLQASIILVSFIGVLWSLSSGFVFRISGYVIDIPGYMVWAAILYAGGASWLSWLAGRRLIKINGERYSKEAALRFSLMRVNEHIDAVSLSSGEDNEKQRLGRDLDSVLDVTRRFLGAVTRLTWVTASYGWVTMVAPIVIAAPVYFSGNLSFGGLMMAVGAFNQVNASLRWFVDNIGSIADWRATLLRVTAFRSAMLRIDTQHEPGKRIAFAEAEDERMVLDRLQVISPGSSMRLREEHVEIMPGERLGVTGAEDVNMTLFFRTIAGLWPWGHGRVVRPKDKMVTFVPRVSYFPPGSLLDALCYPRPRDTFSSEDLQKALARTGLQRLFPMLDNERHADLGLSEVETKLLVFARLLLHRPQWIVFDGATKGLEGDGLARVLAIINEDFAGAAIINIERSDQAKGIVTRFVTLEKDPEGSTLRPFQPMIDGRSPHASAREKRARQSRPG